MNIQKSLKTLTIQTKTSRMLAESAFSTVKKPKSQAQIKTACEKWKMLIQDPKNGTTLKGHTLDTRV